MGDQTEMPTDLEAVYDEQINPLMAQIIAIAKKHGLPMFATFQYGPTEFCTTVVELDKPYAHDRLKQCNRIIYRRDDFASFMETTETQPDGSKVIRITRTG